MNLDSYTREAREASIREAIGNLQTALKALYAKRKQLLSMLEREHSNLERLKDV